MKQNKNLVLTGLIYAIIFLVYNLLVFIIFKQHTPVFWLSYGFMLLAFTAQIVSMLLSFKAADVETIFFGIPLASLSIYYFFAELFVSVVFMIFQTAGVTLAVVIQVVMLAAFTVVAIISLMARDTVQDISQKVKENVQNIKSLLVDVELLIGQCQDPELKISLKKLSETIKYSDPMTNESINDQEYLIMQVMSELKLNIDTNNLADARNTCTKLQMLFVERNKRLAISK